MHGGLTGAAATLGTRIAAVEAAYRECRLCPRDCGVDRLDGPAGAYCGLGRRALVYKSLLSHGEEAAIGPTWLLDLSGCSLRCLFCTEWAHVTDPGAPPGGWLSPKWFAATHERMRGRGACSVSFVGGDPGVNLLGLLEALAAVPAPQRMPVVFNSNGWLAPAALTAMQGVVDCWVIDLKFAAQACAQRLAAAVGIDYLEAVSDTLDGVQAGHAPTTASALPTLLIRHLLMPGHLHCCTLPTIERVAARWPNATFNLMTMYLPFGPAQRPLAGSPELSGVNREEDKRSAIDAAKRQLPRLLVDGQPV